jgi:hypothetical protein
MIEIKTIAQLRKLIKSIGYNVKTETVSFGKYATFFKGKDECPSIFSSKAHLAEWKPLFDLLGEYALDLDEKVYGLSKYFAK